MNIFLQLTLCVLVMASCGRRMPENQIAEPICSAQVGYQVDYATSQIIVLDPGHGGDDFGTRSCQRPYIYEKTLALRTAKLVYEHLKSWGYEVRLTRNRDVFIPLLKRVQLANMCNGRIFVSIHYNSAPSKKASGIEIFFYNDSKNKKRTWRSERLAKTVLASMLSGVQSPSRGVKEGNFAVIRETQMPAVLIEAGFLSHNEEAARLKNPAYLQQLSYSIAKGIENFLKG